MTAVPNLTGVIFILSPLLIAMIVGMLIGRDPLRLTAVRLRWPVLLWAAAAIAAVRYANPAWLPELLRRDSGIALAAAVWVLGAVWVAANLRGRGRGLRVGLLLILVGGAANALAIAANRGAMPYVQAGSRVTLESSRSGDAVGHAAWEAGHHRLIWLSEFIQSPGRLC